MNIEELIFKLHNEYKLNEVVNNKVNIIETYNELILKTENINWNDYSQDIFERYNILVNSINHHLNRWTSSSY